MKWSEAAWQSAQHIICEIERCPFVRELADGTLSDGRFKAYIAQDIIYMRNFEARLRLLHRQTLGTSVSDRLVSNIEDTLAAEKSLHTFLSSQFGIEPEDRKSPANVAYDQMLARLEDEDCAALTFASLLPCYRVYAHIGLLIYSRHDSDSNPYRAWIATYGDPAFRDDADTFRAMCDECADSQTAAVKERMTGYFNLSTSLELRFWNDCYL